MNKINRWLRSKTGIATLVGIVIIALVVVVAGQQLGWWGDGGLSGAAGLPAPSYDDPIGGYTCFPSCPENDGKFLVLPGDQVFSFGNSTVILWISVPGNKASFELGFFDGDAGKDKDGGNNWQNGHWDTYNAEITYTLFADPLKDGQGQMVVASWSSNEMPDNAWFSAQVNTQDEAKGPSGHYFYMLKAYRPPEGSGLSVFKLRSSGYLSTGAQSLEDATFGIMGALATTNDLHVLYPEFKDYSNYGPSIYSGEWQFYFYVPNDQTHLEVWDGDFDRGTTAAIEQDTEDFNTTIIPSWATSFAVMERAGGQGAPADDNKFAKFRRSPAVFYDIIDPDGMPIYTNDEPSGTEEWERFVMSTTAGDPDADLVVERIKPGLYNIHIQGLDLSNAVWLRVNFPVCDPEDGCGPPPWPEGSCPRTIGYWKNNVRKWLPYENKDGSPRGVQESKETLNWGFNNVALASELFRSGLDVNNPQPIANAVPLTWTEADYILQRKYSNSMLSRALQQNLATWMNLGTGKIGPTTVIHLTGIMGGDFDGTIWEALMFAQDVILYQRDDAQLLERAKDIADMINNNEINVDPNEILACEVYEKIIPPDKQPPAHDKMPKAPKKDEPKEVTPGPEPTCDTGNTYTVENTTNNPFYSVKFNFASGTEVKNGGAETFQYSLPSDVVAAMTQMQVEVKAATEARILTLACDFTSPVGCGGEPLADPDGLYAVSFDGAEDNGDGTTTLTFTIYVKGSNGLSHVSFELPSGQVALNLDGSYTTEICVVP